MRRIDDYVHVSSKQTKRFEQMNSTRRISTYIYIYIYIYIDRERERERVIHIYIYIYRDICIYIYIYICLTGMIMHRKADSHQRGSLRGGGHAGSQGALEIMIPIILGIRIMLLLLLLLLMIMMILVILIVTIITYGVRGDHLSNTTCLTQVLFNSRE